MEKEEKEIFYNELYELDREDSDEVDTSNASVVLGQSRLSSHDSSFPTKSLHRSRFIHSSHQDHVLGRTVSAPLPRDSKVTRDEANPLETVSLSSFVSSKIQKQMGILSPDKVKQPANVDAVTKDPKQNGKRKRGKSSEPMPESQQIFNGLAFFFLPNNDIAPARCARIRKAMEWGALWVKEWRSSVTHVIVDRDLCFNDVLKFLKLPSLPPDIVVVSENYPPDCMQFRYLLSPNQPHYRVNGHEVALIMRQSPTLEISSDISLQLKLEKGENASAKNTPSINEDSDGISTSRTHNEKPLIRSSPSDVIQFTPSEHTQDALDDAITEARTVEGLPLDLDEEEHHHDGVFLDEAEDGQSEDEKNPKSKTKSKKGSFARSWQGNFSCMSKHDGAGKSEYPNARTIEVLQQMADYYDRTQDHWRLNAYRKAITALRKQDHKITTEEEAFAVPFIGQRLAAKIEEIVWTDKLRRLENTALEPNDEVLQTFLKIYGVGLKQATKWIDQGYRSIEDLQKAQLTKNQKIGIEHYEDFQLRIPRGEMRRHDQYVREICSKIDARIQFTIGGSYRRGAANSGDIDFIVNMPDCTLNTLRTLMFGTVIPQLETLGYLKVSLATSSKDEGSKWHGAAALPGCSIWRRIDLLFVPWEEMGAALIYFTGNDIFNRSIRLLASRKGMRLNQHGLWKDVIRGKNRERVTQGSLVEGKDEKKIFEVLGVPWRPPEHRIC